MDARDTIVREVTIQNGVFTAVGPRTAAAQPVHEDDRPWRPHGGARLIDNHNHIVLLGMRPGHDIRIETAGSWLMSRRR